MGVAEPKQVQERIAANDHWYTSSQFAWSYGVAKHVHALRQDFMLGWIERAKTRTKKRPLNVVEVGCGDGVNLYRLSKAMDCRFFGYDYNELRLERARKLVPTAEFAAIDLAKHPACPVESGAEVLIFSHVIEHIDDDTGALRHLRQWLAPGGVLLLLTPNEGCMSTRFDYRFVNPQLPAQTDHVHFYNRRSLRRLVSDAGFNILEMRGEVFYFPSYRHHIGLLRRKWGFNLLRLARLLMPSQTDCWQLALEARSP